MSPNCGNRTAAYPSAGTGGAALGATPPLKNMQDKSPRCAGRAVGGVCRGFEGFAHIAAPIRTSRPSEFFSLLLESRTSQEIGP
ncbi:hypothetical protein SAMN02746000_03390 [Paracoccus sp. J56]|nr:hypothetical protein SAMN02746000_03390 [Paracoccus sp. J56]